VQMRSTGRRAAAIALLAIACCAFALTVLASTTEVHTTTDHLTEDLQTEIQRALVAHGYAEPFAAAQAAQAAVQLATDIGQQIAAQIVPQRDKLVGNYRRGKKRDITELSRDVIASILAVHNAARAKAGVKPLVWDSNLALGAQLWADRCRPSHSDAVQRARDYAFRANRTFAGSVSASVGENILAEPVSSVGERVSVSLFVDAGKNWHCRTNKCSRPTSARPGECGLFKQVVSAQTTRIGCGYRVCDSDSPFGTASAKWNNVVCWYNPMSPMGRNARPFKANLCPRRA